MSPSYQCHSGRMGVCVSKEREAREELQVFQSDLLDQLSKIGVEIAHINYSLEQMPVAMQRINSTIKHHQYMLPYDNQRRSEEKYMTMRCRSLESLLTGPERGVVPKHPYVNIRTSRNSDNNYDCHQFCQQ